MYRFVFQVYVRSQIGIPGVLALFCAHQEPQLFYHIISSQREKENTNSYEWFLKINVSHSLNHRIKGHRMNPVIEPRDRTRCVCVCGGGQKEWRCSLLRTPVCSVTTGRSSGKDTAMSAMR